MLRPRPLTVAPLLLARRDPMPFEAHCQYLKQISIQVAGGIAAQVRSHNGTAHGHREHSPAHPAGCRR